jgi:glutamyl-Q tRNA(Asp) synthetase
MPNHLPDLNYVGRFAPSPTGPLHFGSLVACVASYLDARAHGGRWLLRIEDVDTSRCKSSYADEIIATLTAFGFKWDGDIRVQSQQTDTYDAALAQLDSRHLTFGCSCSRKEVADSATAGVDGPVYPGTCRTKGLTANGNALRLRVPATRICFTDRTQGPLCQDLAHDIGDFVLRRRDGLIAYQLAVVVDDAEQNVTHVVRGADLLDSTARQIYLQQALGLPTPTYLHIPVVTNADGQKLSKQTLAPAISPAEAAKTLLQALAFLGQTTTVHQQNSSPVEILHTAVFQWHANEIPRQRAMISATFGDSQASTKLLT